MEGLFESDLRYSTEITAELHAARGLKRKVLERFWSTMQRIL
jgi:hypothetical protein